MRSYARTSQRKTMNPPNQSSKTAELEVIQPSALESLERASIDVQVSTAHRFPRSLEKFRERALSMVSIDEETAESCIYRRPVGKKKNEKGQWVEEYAEGASIRMAEIVAACYGNLRVASRIIEQTDRHVKCEGVAHDLESNYAGKSEAFEPTVKQSGEPYSEGMRAVVAKACLAKVYRDAVFKVVPRALCKVMYQKAMEVATGTTRPIEQRRAKVKAWLNSIRVDDTRVFAALGINGWSEVGNEQLLILTGLKTAIADKDTTVEEAFPMPTKAPEFPDRAPAGASGAPGNDTAKTAGSPPPAKEAATATAAPGGVSTPTAAANAAQQPASEAGTPKSSTVPPAGVAPAAPAGQTVQPDPAQPEAGADFKPNPAETEACQSVRLLMAKSGVTEAQVMAYAHGEGKMAKEAQKHLTDLSDAKLITLGKAWHNVLPKIRGQ